MADVQPEHGYTKIADELLEAVAKYRLNGTQFRIIIVVWRFTYGFSRKDHELSLTFFTKATGLGKTQIDRELTNLIERNVLIVTAESTFTRSRKLMFNKDYDTWKRDDSQQEKVQSAKMLTVSEKEDEQSAELLTRTVSENADQDIHSFINNSINNISPIEVELTQEDILERSYDIEYYFCMKRGKGLKVGIDDFACIQKVVAHPIPVDFIKSIIDKAFADYKPKHGFDKLTNFSYVAPRCMDEYMKSTSKVTPIRIGQPVQQWQKNKKVNQKQVLPIAQNDSEARQLTPEEREEMQRMIAKMGGSYKIEAN